VIIDAPLYLIAAIGLGLLGASLLAGGYIITIAIMDMLRI
jgi:hypothetical protein